MRLLIYCLSSGKPVDRKSHALLPYLVIRILAFHHSVQESGYADLCPTEAKSADHLCICLVYLYVQAV